MERKSAHKDERALYTKANLLIGLAIAAFICLLVCLLFYRNPWVLHRMNSEEVTGSQLQEIASGNSPYVTIEDMTLTYTGYCKVNEEGNVCSYCYVGNVGDQCVLVDMLAEDNGELASDPDASAAVMNDYTLYGQVKDTDDIVSTFAEAEGISVSDYREEKNIVPVEISSYQIDADRWRVYQMMAIVLIVGCMAAGLIVRSEAALSDSEQNK